MHLLHRLIPILGFLGIFVVPAIGETYTYELRRRTSSVTTQERLDELNTQGARSFVYRGIGASVTTGFPDYGIWECSSPTRTYAWHSHPLPRGFGDDVFVPLHNEQVQSGYQLVGGITTESPDHYDYFFVNHQVAPIWLRRAETQLFRIGSSSLRTAVIAKGAEGYLYMGSAKLDSGSLSREGTAYVFEAGLKPYDVVIEPAAGAGLPAIIVARAAQGYRYFDNPYNFPTNEYVGTIFWRRRGENTPVGCQVIPAPNYSLDGARANELGAQGYRFHRFTTIVDGSHAIFYQERPFSGSAPLITRAPEDRSVTQGDPVTFTAEVREPTAVTYQWRKDGVLLPDATGAILVISAVQTVDAGTYDVVATNATGASVSPGARLTVSVPVLVSRIINLSVLTDTTDSEPFTLGYVVGGPGTAGTKPVLVRAAGPSLAGFGVNNPLPDPHLEFFAGAAKLGENDDWGGGTDLVTAIARVGAFPFLSPSSKDAAAVALVAKGDNSIRLSTGSKGAGTVLAEIYDGTPTTDYTATTPRLINVSVSKHLGAGLTVGFVITRPAAAPLFKTVLIRAVGPTLRSAPFNVADTVADPRLALYSGTTKIAENDDWSAGPSLSTTFTAVGAFALLPGSKDAALTQSLIPGSYSVRVTGTGGTGVALVEIYEVP